MSYTTPKARKTALKFQSNTIFVDKQYYAFEDVYDIFFGCIKKKKKNLNIF